MAILLFNLKNSTMAERGRDLLKNFFKNGKRPTESDFSDLIDSTVNKLDDGYTKSDNDGLKLTAKGSNKTIITLCEEEKVSWKFFFQNSKLVLQNYLKGFSRDNQSKEVLEVRSPTTNIEGDLNINGDFSISGVRKGASVSGMAADGKWHTITALNYGVYAMEVSASVHGRSGNGKYAVLVGWATQAFGSGRKIRTISSHYGFWGNRLKLRWKKVKDKNGAVNYQLQVRTKTNYNDSSALINCNLTLLHSYEKADNQKT
ncbi:hypothetical protein [Sphingobacterium paucimobilis]|nr:hypothetical protein [Sphingobacterium paucimobilis]